jgi:L-asparaginase II
VAAPISVVVERGGVVEAVHRVHAVAVRDGDAVEAAGDPALVTLMRSAAKPLQALPLAREVSDLPADELAIACASHEATDEQLAAVRALLARSGSGGDELECGEEGGSKLAHNCSGKHAGMLLRSKRHGWPLPGYRLPEHPLQQNLRRVVASAVGEPEEEMPTATDGCGVVTFAVALAAMASAFSRLVRGELGGADRVVEAMRVHPNLVGGPKAADTALMRALPATIAKRGAEGLLCAALPDGTGVALKVEDGANRAAGPALAHFLGIDSLREEPIVNSRCEEVGRVFPRSSEKRIPVFPKRV